MEKHGYVLIALRSPTLRHHNGRETPEIFLFLFFGLFFIKLDLGSWHESFYN